MTKRKRRLTQADLRAMGASPGRLATRYSPEGRAEVRQLTADLMAINEERWVTPLPDTQVIKIARSIHRREPCNQSKRATPEVLEALDVVEARLWTREWRGMGGKSERDAYIALLKASREHGEMIPGGVRASLGVRDWALATGVSKRAMFDHRKRGERKPGIISRLKRAGLVRADSTGRRDGEAGAFVLVMSAEFHHSSTGGKSGESGETLRSPRLRWSAPVLERVGDETIRSVITRLGKTRGQVIDTLEAAGGELHLQDLYGRLYPDRSPSDRGRWRPWDFRRRVLPRLEAAAVVECSGEIGSLTRDWREALEREREVAGEIAAERRDRARYAREREAFARRHEIRPEPVPEYPAGEIGELERVPDVDAELVEALEGFLQRNPHRTQEKPSWLSVALWADEYLPSKPLPEAVEMALAELGAVA
jgi:hypothetical protein